jgi:hypothetical protein
VPALLIGAAGVLMLGGALFPVLSIVSTVPGERARRHWENDYASLLPPNYSDFRAHWQNPDVGVRIFSFRCPPKMTGDQVLQHLSDGLTGFKPVDKGINEIAVRRSVTYADPDGFDEFRFVYVPATHRAFALFANLDDEMDAHDGLVKKLKSVAESPQ